MTMKPDAITALVDDLKPVMPVTPAHAWSIVGGATLIAVIAIVGQFGLRADLAAGTPHPMVLVRGGTLLLLGIAATLAVITAARPSVGQSSQGWRWALAAAALFPLSSLVLTAISGRFPRAVLEADSGPWCLALSSASALLIGGGLVAWLRTGAPTNPNRTAWLTGLAAGAFGAFAYSLHCPSDTVQYVGLWYTSVIALCAGAGRLIIPRLIRW